MTNLHNTDTCFQIIHQQAQRFGVGTAFADVVWIRQQPEALGNPVDWK